MGHLIIIILLVAVIWAIIYYSGSAPGKTSRLKNQYISLSNQPPEIAEKTLREQLERLKEKHPGRSEKWYMEKIIYDLQKDR